MNEQDIFKVRQTDVEIQEIFDQVPKNKKAIEDINGKLPAEASPENPLTDKEYVDGKVGDEANARQEAVNAEQARAKGVEQTLQGGISSEAQTRQQADQTLDGKIAANTQAIAAEKTRAEGAEQVLDGKIAANTQAIANEKARAEGVEMTLQQGISTEAQTRQQADQTLDGKITANTQAIATEKTRAEGAEQALQSAIDIINGKIPAQTTAQNQLADKAFVNSSISTATADFRGTYNSLEDLDQVTANANDYAFVIATDAAGNTVYKRFKWVYGSGWTWEYDLNNSSFTAAQWAAIQSGITAALVTKLTDLPTNAELNQRISTAITTALEQYYTKAEIDTALQAINTAIGQETTRLNTLNQGLNSGDVVPALATNLASWEGVEGESDYVQTEPADTTGGTLSIDSSMPANLLSVVPTSDFGATALVATGFNLLRFVTAVGAGWYILVPKLIATAASIGTAQENNGVLFTDAQGNNLRPTVRFKALADGVPTSVTDGVAATYVDKDERRHYTTPGIGYLIVSDINRATTCMHLAWSRRYDEYVAVDAAGDAGATVNLAAGINALHDFGLMLQIGALADSIERTSATQVTWYRRVERVQPTWTNTPVEEEGVATGQYLHEALISNMRPDGAAAFMGSDQALTVAGTTVSYTDGNAEALTNYVKFELAAVASGTASVSSSFAVEDWGLILIQGATGTAAFTIAYAQGIPDNLRTALPQLNAIRTTAAAISLGHGICSTGVYEKDKVVSIPNFLLLLNGTVNVLFTAPINTERATLNVNMTGAKPLRILGQSLPAGVVKAQTYATLCYDGESWNIVNLFCPGAEYDPAGLLVDMGLPSGVKWAARDIDLTKPGGFCDTPFTYMKSFFSWGNIDGHNPISNLAFDYNWGGVNETDPYYEGQPYGDTPGNTLTGNIAVGEDFDAARANLGAPWRMPTSAEFGELFANIIYIDANGDEVDTTNTDKRVTVNGILGLYIQSKINGARLFFSCSGYGLGRSWNYRGSGGNVWSSTWSSARDARNLGFYSGGVRPQNYSYRYYGFALRPVQ